MNSFWTVVHIHHVLWRSAPPHVCVCVWLLLPWKHPHLGVTLHRPSTLSCSLILGDHHIYDILPLLRSLPWLPTEVSAFSFPSSPSQAMPPSWEAGIRPIKQGPACRVAGGPTLPCQWASSHPPTHWKVFVKVSGCVGQTFLPWTSAVFYLDFTASRGLAPHWHRIRPAVTLAQGCSNQLGNFKKETENTFKY